MKVLGSHGRAWMLHCSIPFGPLANSKKRLDDDLLRFGNQPLLKAPHLAPNKKPTTKIRKKGGNWNVPVKMNKNKLNVWNFTIMWKLFSIQKIMETHRLLCIFVTLWAQYINFQLVPLKQHGWKSPSLRFREKIGLEEIILYISTYVLTFF